MVHYTNEYRYTTETAKRIAGECWAAASRASLILRVVLFLAMLGLWAATRNSACLVALVLGLGSFVLSFFERRKMIRTIVERKQLDWGETAPTIRVEIGDDICQISNDKEKHYSFADLKAVKQGKGYVFLFMKGQLYLVLDKNGFMKGEKADECIRYLRLHLPSGKGR